MKTLSTVLLTALIAFDAGVRLQFQGHHCPRTAGTMPAISALAPTSTTSGGPAFMLDRQRHQLLDQRVDQLERHGHNHHLREREPADGDDCRPRTSQLRRPCQLR